MRRPLFIAKQSGKPSGWIGRAVASIMERETAETNREAIALLDPGRGDRVLDIGCGNGLSLQLLATDHRVGLAVGVDHSPVMCELSAKTNRSLIAEGKVRVVCERSDDLPFRAGCFDAVMSVHTLYFWERVEPHVREIARVLSPGGRMALAFRPDTDPAAEGFPASVYKFRAVDDVERTVSRCGFESVRKVPGSDDVALLRAVRSGEQASPAWRPPTAFV